MGTPHLSHLSPFYSNITGLVPVSISRIVFQPCPHWSGLYGIINHVIFFRTTLTNEMLRKHSLPKTNMIRNVTRM